MGTVLFLFALAGLCFWVAPKLVGVTPEKTATAKQNYEKALSEGNRAEALKWGREYFAALRWSNGYRLTIYDEQRIQNDISAHCS